MSVLRSLEERYYTFVYVSKQLFFERYKCILYYQALKRNNNSATLYIFPTGGHGWGMKNTFQYKREMLTLLKSWLDDI
ncbi:Acetylxylan esterase [termite gut metagenome]|uniref:Acetylxylan esterase n=1 Tax=termite gut metagenome TaxID=433724 RepID=A0A5J4QCF1_9ZZZZ